MTDWQERASADTRRFKLLRYGRRAGKDVINLRAAIYGHGPAKCPGKPRCPRAPHSTEEPCFRGLLDGLDVVWLAPEFPLALLFWHQEIEPRFKESDKVRLNRSEHSVTLEGYGTLWIRSAENIDAVRGVGKFLAGVIINEAAHMDLEHGWKKVIRPALMDNRGWSIISSTTNAALDGNAEKRTPSYFNVLCQEVLDGKRNEDEWAEFHGDARDNPLIDSQELAGLVSEYTPDSIPLKEEVYAELLEGRIGLVFSEFNEKLHVTAKELEIPSHWRWGAGLDFGFRAPGCFEIFACGPDGDIVAWDELYFKGLHAYEAGRQCGLKARMTPLEYIACDEAMDQRHGNSAGAVQGPTILEEFQQGLDAAYGGRGRGPRLIKTAKGPGSRTHRVQLTHHWLAWRIDPATGTVPPLWMPALKMHPRCANLIRTLPKLPYDPLKLEDVDTTAEDHAYDALSYFLMSRPPKAHAWVEAEDENTHPGFDFRQRERKQRRYEQNTLDTERPHFLPRGPLVEAE